MNISNVIIGLLFHYYVFALQINKLKFFFLNYLINMIWLVTKSLPQELTLSQIHSSTAITGAAKSPLLQ